MLRSSSVIRCQAAVMNPFFDSVRQQGSKLVVGRPWKAEELRTKSFEDLHKLWFVLQKERNMIATEKLVAKREGKRMQRPDRIRWVRKSLARIQVVLGERRREDKAEAAAVRAAIPPPAPLASSKVYVANMPDSFTSVTLKKVFGHLGPIKDTLLIQTRPSNGKQKGLGYIEFNNGAAAAKALEHMHDFDVSRQGQPEWRIHAFETIDGFSNTQVNTLLRALTDGGYAHKEKSTGEAQA